MHEFTIAPIRNAKGELTDMVLLTTGDGYPQAILHRDAFWLRPSEGKNLLYRAIEAGEAFKIKVEMVNEEDDHLGS